MLMCVRAHLSGYVCTCMLWIRDSGGVVESRVGGVEDGRGRGGGGFGTKTLGGVCLGDIVGGGGGVGKGDCYFFG